MINAPGLYTIFICRAATAALSMASSSKICPSRPVACYHRQVDIEIYVSLRTRYLSRSVPLPLQVALQAIPEFH